MRHNIEAVAARHNFEALFDQLCCDHSVTILGIVQLIQRHSHAVWPAGAGVFGRDMPRQHILVIYHAGHVAVVVCYNLLQLVVQSC